MNHMEEKHKAMCGLNCSSCAAFIATENNDNKLREKTAKDWTEKYGAQSLNKPAIKPVEINCSGCLSQGPLYKHCYECEIRKCGFDKGIENCAECEKYKCNKLVELQSNFF